MVLLFAGYSAALKRLAIGFPVLVILFIQCHPAQSASHLWNFLQGCIPGAIAPPLMPFWCTHSGGGTMHAVAGLPGHGQ